MSDGDEFTPFEHEQQDGHEAIEWAAAMPGSSGRVGMYGGSYVGATQLMAAPTRSARSRRSTTRAGRTATAPSHWP